MGDGKLRRGRAFARGMTVLFLTVGVVAPTGWAQADTKDHKQAHKADHKTDHPADTHAAEPEKSDDGPHAKPAPAPDRDDDHPKAKAHSTAGSGGGDTIHAPAPNIRHANRGSDRLPRMGDFELRLALAPGTLGRFLPGGFNISNLNGFTWAVGASAGVGYFITDHIEVGGGAGIGLSGGDNVAVTVNVPLLGFWRYCWHANDWIMLWAGNNLGFIYFGNPYFAIGGNGGAEFFIVRGWSIWAGGYVQGLIGGAQLVDAGLTYGTSLYF